MPFGQRHCASLRGPSALLAFLCVGLPASLSSCAVTANGDVDSEGAIAEQQSSADRNYKQTISGTEIGFEMVWIPDGGFWMGRCEVTWDEFLAYCDFEATGAVPPGADVVSKPSVPLDWTPYDRDWGVGKRPAVGMSWNSARKYCEWLSVNTGQSYQLPTEAEWLLACADAESTAAVDGAWCADNSDGKTQEVGQKQANRFGLHDMLGNLWEYSADPWAADEPNRAVLRGGCWRDAGAELKAATRLEFDNSWTLDDPNFPPGVWWIPEGSHLGLRVLRRAEDGIAGESPVADSVRQDT